MHLVNKKNTKFTKNFHGIRVTFVLNRIDPLCSFVHITTIENFQASVTTPTALVTTFESTIVSTPANTMA